MMAQFGCEKERESVYLVPAKLDSRRIETSRVLTEALVDSLTGGELLRRDVGCSSSATLTSAATRKER